MEYIFSDKIKNLKPSAIREILKATSEPGIIAFAAGNPSEESFPVTEMRELAAEIFETNPAQALQYGITEGYAPLIEKVRERLETRFNINKNEFDKTIIVSGAQQGIDLACKALCNEGDTVICENPSFIGALNSFRSYNTNLVGVDMDEYGIDINKLEEAVKENKNVRLIYLIPTFQNPSGKTMTEQRRREVYEVARKNNIIILEDNPYGELRFAGDEVMTLKSIDTDGIVIYCGSFSKILSPGIRLGFVCAPSQIVQKMVVAKQAADVHTNLFYQILAAMWMERYDLDSHINKICEIYRHKCGLMLLGIKEHFDKNITVVEPQGGLFLWCDFPEGYDITGLCRRALDNKIAVVPGSAFTVNPLTPCYAIRLNYSTPTNQQIITGIEILGKLTR